jgi:hypothetical protein
MNRTRIPEINPQIFSQLILKKSTRTDTQWRKTASSINGAGKTGAPHVEG